MAGERDDPPTLDDQICFALYGASMAMGRVYKPMLDALGLTYPQYLVLHALWEVDGRTIGALAGRLSLDPSTVTPLVKRLAAAGFVTRARDTADERLVNVTLTEKGRAARADGACLTRAILSRTGLGSCDVTDLVARLRTLRDTLANPGEGAP